MPRVQIPITVVAETGTAQPSAVTGDATNDHYLVGTTDFLLELKNTSGGALDAELVTSYVTEGGLDLEENVISCTAGQIKYALVNTSAKRLRYQQSADSDFIHLNISSNSWEFRAFAV